MTTWKLVFSDDFSTADDIDRTKWESPHWTPDHNQAYLGRSGIRNPTDFTGEYRELGLIPCTSENGADLRFCTYNPLAQPAGSALLGSELHTIEKWGGNGETVKFEAKVKCPQMPGGAVTSVFSFARCPGWVQNEIDFEFASYYWGPPPSQTFFTNVFVCSSGGGSGPEIMSTGDNLMNWHTFSLIYSPSEKSVEWQIDGYSVRKDLQHVPDWKVSGGMGLYMNFWAPNSDWAWAYDGNLKPAATGPGDTWHYYVKNAAVYYAT